MISLDSSISVKKSLIVFVALYSIAAIPVQAGTRLDRFLDVLTTVPLFVYNQDFTTISIKQEQFNYFSFTRLVSVLFAAFVLFAVTQRHPRKLRFQLMDVLFISFLGYRIVSEVVLSRAVNVNLLSYMIIAGVLYILLIQQCDQHVERSLYKTLAWVGVANAVVILWQVFVIGLNVGGFVLRDFSNQPRGMLMDAVVASIYMTVSLVVLLEGVFPVNPLKKIVCILLLVVACVLTGSRGFVILWLVYAVLRLKAMFGSFRRIMILVASASALVAVILSVSGREVEDVVNNFQTLVEFERDPSSMARKEKVQSSVVLFQDNPFFGVGSNNFQASISPGGVSDATLTENPHNVYAQVLAENGLAGALLLGWLGGVVIINRGRVQSSLRAMLVVLAIGVGYIGALGSLPLVVMFVVLLAIYRSDMRRSARPVVA